MTDAQRSATAREGAVEHIDLDDAWPQDASGDDTEDGPE
jgi:hypothetical protein